ncbi:bifunctional lysylphosphatidylglycerol flippase/synthetase MprF [Streptoverticillium reticulum]|uniref:bifunctional lysylphosphatidylglycerol flippase/synthetase MprF n=1 Tax=Streptoverticillium reticulum TaxID=1433415 RepID=UPI0039BFD00E
MNAVNAESGSAPAPPPGPTVGDTTHPWRATLDRLLVPVRHAPFTLAFLAVLWIVGAVTGSLGTGPSRHRMERVGVGVPSLAEGRWWTPASSLLWCPGLGGYIGATIVVLLAVTPSERRLGVARTAGALLGGQILGTLLGVGIVKAGSLAGEWWLDSLTDDLSVSPTVGALAVGAVLSYRLTALWRRRMRLGIAAFALVMALYVGHLQGVLRLCGAFVGMLAGAALYHRTWPIRLRHSSHTEARVLVALVVAASAIGPMVAILYKDAYGPFNSFEALYVSVQPTAQEIADACAASAQDCHSVHAVRDFYDSPAVVMSALVPLVLLVLAEGLRRGLRLAWGLAVLVNLFWMALFAYWLHDFLSHPTAWGAAPSEQSGFVQAFAEQMLLPFLVLVLLVLTRARFDLRLPHSAMRGLAAVVGGALLVACAAYVGIGWAVRDQFDPPATPGLLVGGLVSEFLPPAFLDAFTASPVPVGGIAQALFRYCGLFFWLITLVALLVTFRRPRLHTDADAAVRARELLTAHGGSNLSFLTTWDGNHYWFDAPGRAAVAYRVISTVALTTGDPFGAPDARAAAVAGFSRYCDERGWTPCFYSAGPDTRAAAEALGWRSVQVAEDTVVPLPDLAFTGKKWQDVRTALNKAKKEGITAEWWSFRDAPVALTDQVRSISEEWVADKGLPEMGFTLGGLDELDDPAVRCLLAVDADRTVHGITSWMPVYENGEPVGWTLDFMRRRASGFRGSMEFLIASAALGFQEEGARFLSLSGAPLARKATEEPPAALQRVLDFAGKVLEPVYGFRSLLNFKAKFQPHYRPMYMAYPDPAALAVITRAIAKAYLPHMTAAQGVRLMRQFSS